MLRMKAKLQKKNSPVYSKWMQRTSLREKYLSYNDKDVNLSDLFCLPTTIMVERKDQTNFEQYADFSWQKMWFCTNINSNPLLCGDA